MSDSPFDRTYSQPPLKPMLGQIVEAGWLGESLPEPLRPDQSYVFRAAGCDLYVQPRPPYCNRGQYLVLCEWWDPLTGSRDATDEPHGWPRYYFFRETMLLELEAWLEAQHQWPADYAERGEPGDDPKIIGSGQPVIVIPEDWR